MSGSTGRKVWPESQTHGETMVLEAIASGRRLDEILELLIQTTEQQYAGMIGSILFLEGPNLYARIPNSLPDFYNEAIDGLAIGEGVGSCGTAAQRGEPGIDPDSSRAHFGNQ